jgi:predicted Zn finger-like uncharacterized protein
MSTLIDCPSCGRKLRVPEEFLGKMVRCPSCGETFDAPEPAAAALPPPAEAAPAPQPAGPSPLLTVPVNLELGDAPAAPQPAPAAPPREAPQRRPDRERDDDDDDDYDRRRGRSRRRRDFEPCPRCGDDVRRGAVACPHCGLDLEEQGDGYSRRGRVRLDAEPHRAGTVQALGIASLVLGACYVFPIGFPLGIAAWVMGRRDLKKMEDGVMDPDGRKKTRDGWLCGLVGTLLNAVWAVCCVGLVMLIVAEASSSPPVPPPPPPVRLGGAKGQGLPQAGAPFTLSGPAKEIILKRGQVQTFTVQVRRGQGFFGNVTLSADQELLPDGVTLAPARVTLAGGQMSQTFKLTATRDADPGPDVLQVSATDNVGNMVPLEVKFRVVEK